MDTEVTHGWHNPVCQANHDRSQYIYRICERRAELHIEAGVTTVLRDWITGDRLTAELPEPIPGTLLVPHPGLSTPIASDRGAGKRRGELYATGSMCLGQVCLLSRIEGELQGILRLDPLEIAGCSRGREPKVRRG